MKTELRFSGLAVLGLALSLTACGGGGDATPAPVTVPPVVVVPAPVVVVDAAGTLQASVANPAYTVDSKEMAFYRALSAARVQAGAGAVTQTAQLDFSAGKHVEYLDFNVNANLAQGVSLHTQTLGTAGFYAATPDERISKAGFPSAVTGEVIFASTGAIGGLDCVDTLLTAVYHGAVMLGPYTHVGISLSSNTGTTNGCVANFATRAGAGSSTAQVPSAGAMVMYPYNGQTSVPSVFYVNTEKPRVPVTLLPNATAGAPVIVSIRNADFLNAKANAKLVAQITKFEMTDASRNLVQSVILANPGITGSGVVLNSDANMFEGFAALVPLSPLVPGAAYNVKFTATVAEGKTVSKEVNFTTAP